jgi:hypothetical protein
MLLTQNSIDTIQNNLCTTSCFNPKLKVIEIFNHIFTNSFHNNFGYPTPLNSTYTNTLIKCIPTLDFNNNVKYMCKLQILTNYIISYKLFVYLSY